MIDADRALRAYEDVVAIEADDEAGVYRIVTTSDVYHAVPEEGMHLCPDREYHDPPEGYCKHLVALEAVRGRLDIPTGWLTVDDLDDRTDESFDLDADVSRQRLRDNHTLAAFDGGQVATDGGERPEDCRCDEFELPGELPCWPCAREGFDERPEVDA